MIVGGGIVGWLCVGMLVVKFGKQGECYWGVEIILIELLDVSIIGVGEGFWFLFCDIFCEIGLLELVFIIYCQVLFK